MGDALWDIAVNLLAVFIVFMARLLGFDAYARLSRLGRRLPMAARRLRGAETVLIYTDCDDELHTSRSLADALEEHMRSMGRKVRFTIVKDDVGLARFPFSASRVLAVVVLLTDVTQLSSSGRTRARLQNRLIRYVHRGGRLVVGHDAIYRRARNERLQRISGGVLDDFRRVEGPIDYVRLDEGARASSNGELLEALPPNPRLVDNEVMVGEWNADVEYLYTWGAQEDPIPLVTRRCVGQGRVFWINSGDTSAKGPPRSLARPESDLVAMLNTLIAKG